MGLKNQEMMTNQASPKISLVTINYRQIDVTLQFLESTKFLTYPNFEIILIDNGCVEDNSKLISTLFPEVVYFLSKDNLGFAGANNLGMSLTKCDYFFIVNNDTEVTPDLLQNLLVPFLKNRNVGAVSPKIKYFDNPEVIQYAGFTKVNSFTGRNLTIGYNQKDIGQYDTARKTSYAHGAAMLVKREVVEKIGGFSEEYFMYYEELDWSERMLLEGYEIFYEPSGVIYHKASMSIGKNSTLKTYYHTRNRILFMRRTYSGIHLLIFYFYFSIVVVPATVLRYILEWTPSHIMPFFKGVFWNMGKSSMNDKQLVL